MNWVGIGYKQKRHHGEHSCEGTDEMGASTTLRKCTYITPWILSVWTNIYLSLSIFIPVAPTWSIGHPWNASFHFSFSDSRQDSLDRGSARRKAVTYTQTYNKCKHPCLEWDSNQRSSVHFQTFHALDRAATVISEPVYKL
jgi:hypothetical protein